jgi:hypothetical protein
MTGTDLRVTRAAELVHVVMFMTEFTRAASHKASTHFDALTFFLSRAGGLQLLMLLLNAAYHKPQEGRCAGWPFGVLRARVDISERALRMLLNDAVNEKLVVKTCVDLDRRYVIYSATTQVIDAWEEMFAAMRTCVGDALDTFSPGMLANVDYGNANTGALPQQPRSPVTRHLKSAATSKHTQRVRTSYLACGGGALAKA